MLAGCASFEQESFATPEAAVRALADAAGSGDTKRAEQIFGPDGVDILKSGDEVADHDDVLAIKAMIAKKLEFEAGEDGARIARLGEDGWPLPIPLVPSKGGWRFDVEAGQEEIHNRRIGRNELSTLATLHAYVEAQREYQATGRDGNPPAYARQLMSSEGKRDGLYWPVGEGEAESPFGPEIAAATEEGYRFGSGEPSPYHGYFFRVLEGQGQNAPGGKQRYLDAAGRMTGGFAAIAWPAKHGNSGVMTFVVSHRGIVYQKDLGEDTEKLAKAIVAFDPDSSWTPTPD